MFPDPPPHVNSPSRQTLDAFAKDVAVQRVIERFIRSLKEHGFWLHRFKSLEEARAIYPAIERRKG